MKLWTRPLPPPPWWNPRVATAAAAVLALVVVGLQVVVEIHGWVPGDRLAKWLFDHPRTYRVQRLGDEIGKLGLPSVAIVTVLALALYAWATAGVRYAAMACAASTVVLASTALKLVFGPSPLTLQYDPDAFGSLPSGHVAYATAVFGFATFLLWRQRLWPLALGTLVVVLAMGPARVASGAHWPSDVLAGYALGLSWLLVVLVVGLPRADARTARRGGPSGPRRARDAPYGAGVS